MTTKIVLIVVVVVILLLIIMLLKDYNALIRLRNQVDEAFSTMDIYLKKRFDLIPNLVETVKGYAKHESETLENVIKMRNSAVSPAEQVEAENQITGALRGLFALSESYPDLKANENFMDLSQQLQKIELDIAESRKYYNGCVKIYNDKCMVFPSNIVASLFHFEKRTMFAIQNPEEAQNVKVQF
ncbi:MAG: LemA family protein [Lachnospiraceae bacterium]|nr:LemA family protein [Lachnospiraceae bacterium]